MARRQLSIKEEKSASWFIGMKDNFLKYDLPLPWDLFDSPPNKLAWKKRVKQQVDIYWSEAIKSRALLYPSLKYLQAQSYVPGSNYPVIRETLGVKGVPRIHTKVKILTGSYILQVNRASFNQNQVSPTCLLCKEEEETTEHFMLYCSSLNSIRQSILDEMIQIGYCLGMMDDSEDDSQLLEIILDSTTVFREHPELDNADFVRLERQTRRLYYALHTERYKRLPRVVTKRKRQCRKGGPSTNSSKLKLHF